LKKFVQTVSYLPHFISVAVIAGMTIMFLNPNNGLINNIIVILGGQPNYFMSKPEYFRTIYIITDIWQGAGWGSIIYLAAISSIGPELYESAVLDGADKFKQILHITLPGIAQTIVIMFILNTGSIVSIGFDKPFLLQNTLNISVAEVLSTYVYKKGIQYMNYSFATAAGFFNSVISLIFVYASNFMSRKFGENNLF
jgi:putative aldouronate transport system permease protein